MKSLVYHIKPVMNWFDKIVIAYVTPLWWMFYVCVKIADWFHHDNVMEKGLKYSRRPENSLWGVLFVIPLLVYTQAPFIVVYKLTSSPLNYIALYGGVLWLIFCSLYGLIRRQVFSKHFTHPR
jgi:hypothetical protein